jgi:hypothetical protein
VCAFALLPERGRNLTLEETLWLVLADGQRESLRGPDRIHPELYRRAVLEDRHDPR